jgi:hypothetical protein
MKINTSFFADPSENLQYGNKYKTTLSNKRIKGKKRI